MNAGISEHSSGRLVVQLLRWMLGIGLGIGFLVLLNQLQIPYYLYYPRTTQTVLISDSYDLYFFLTSSLSVPCALAVYSKRVSKSFLIGLPTAWLISLILTVSGRVIALPVLYVTIISAATLCVVKGNSGGTVIGEILPATLTVLILVECPSLFYWIAAALNPQQQVGLLSQQAEASLTYSLYPLAAVMLLLAMFSWLWIPIVKRLSRSKNHLLVRYQPSMSKWNLRSIAASLDLIAMISVAIFFYSYLAGQSWVVGVDSHLRYLDPLNQLSTLTLPQALRTSYEHGAYLVALYILKQGTGLGSFTLVKYAPLVLTFVIGSAAFFAAHGAGWNLQLGLLTAISTLLWLPTTLGIYAGIQANWIALIFWMLFLSIYFLKHEWTVVTYLVLGLLSLAILLVHPWSWGVFITTLALTAAIVWRTPWKHNCLQGLFAALIIAVPVGFSAYGIVPGLSSDFANTLQLYTATALNPTSMLTFGGALLEMFYNWGSFLSPTLLLISLLGATALYRRQGIAANYLLAWTATWCAGSILVAPLGYNPANVGISETGLWRMLYVSPLPFLLALGLQRCLQFAKPQGNEQASNPPQHPLSQFLPTLWATPLLLISAGLVLSPIPVVRLLLVIGALIAAFLLLQLPGNQAFETLLWFALILLLLNAAFRSLFPLLLDPHNLISTVTTTSSGTGR